MTNQDILSIFTCRYPELHIDKYMPCWIDELNNEGIMILLDNGDALIYFPKMNIDEVRNDR